MTKCPKCRIDTVEFKTREGVELSYCYHGCKGIWFDRGEMAMYCETSQNIPLLDKLLPEAKETTFTCARCPDSNLREVPYMPGSDTKVDWCPKCHGVFLDARELAKVEQLANQFEPQSVRLRRAIKHLEENGYSVGIRKARA